MCFSRGNTSGRFRKSTLRDAEHQPIDGILLVAASDRFGKISLEFFLRTFFVSCVSLAFLVFCFDMTVRQMFLDGFEVCGLVVACTELDSSPDTLQTEIKGATTYHVRWTPLSRPENGFN